MPSTTAITAKRERNNMVQIFKALAIVAVVMIHTTPAGVSQVLFRPFINFSVATFLFLSGYLTKAENDNWGAFYKKRITRVLIPYVIWTVVYTVFSGHIGRLPMNLLTAKAAAPLYYVLVYIQFVLLTPLLCRLARSKYQFLGWLVAPAAVIAFNYSWLWAGREPGAVVSVIWSDACLGWFTFYYLGLVLGNRIIEKNHSLKALVLLYVLSIVLQIAEGYGWLRCGQTNCGTQLKLSSLLASALFILITYAVLKRGRLDVKNRFLRMLGDYSFGVYLCHMMVIKLLKAYVPVYQSVPYPVTSLLVVLLGLCFCVAADKALGAKMGRWLGLR